MFDDGWKGAEYDLREVRNSLQPKWCTKNRTSNSRMKRCLLVREQMMDHLILPDWLRISVVRHLSFHDFWLTEYEAGWRHYDMTGRVSTPLIHNSGTFRHSPPLNYTIKHNPEWQKATTFFLGLKLSIRRKGRENNSKYCQINKDRLRTLPKRRSPERLFYLSPFFPNVDPEHVCGENYFSLRNNWGEIPKHFHHSKRKACVH